MTGLVAVMKGLVPVPVPTTRERIILAIEAERDRIRRDLEAASPHLCADQVERIGGLLGGLDLAASIARETPDRDPIRRVELDTSGALDAMHEAAARHRETHDEEPRP